MRVNTFRSLLVLCLSLCLSLQSWAQEVVRFQVNNVEGEKAMVINLFVSELLTNFNQAADKGVLPDINDPDFITAQAWRNIRTSWETNYSFSCPEELVIESANISRAHPNEYEIRHIPLMMHNPTPMEAWKKYQEATVHLSEINGYFKITNFALSIDSENYANIMAQANDVTELTQLSVILDYVERLRNAYCIKDLDFLEQVYSDDALIITGRVVKTRSKDMPKKTEYKKYTKRDYINHLSDVFRRNAHIDVTFSDIQVKAHPIVAGIYGVELFQGYRSTGYEDEGYLFLLWDFREEQPQIHIRTWQDKRIWETQPNEKKYDLEDFNINDL